MSRFCVELFSVCSQMYIDICFSRRRITAASPSVIFSTLNELHVLQTFQEKICIAFFIGLQYIPVDTNLDILICMKAGPNSSESPSSVFVDSNNGTTNFHPPPHK